MLERYSYLVNNLDKPEAELLNYLSLANFSAPTSAADENIPHVLAQLLSWSKSEILTLIQTLPGRQATTVAEVDWLYRCKNTCQASGLTAASLLLATTLNPASPASDWQAVGEAAMAASR
ncbi:hypothetical protein [Pseudomonas sp. NA-150]|uniref:hypothetical protein n=1 Tax=Pseudomonas sp. NA-150 TaxID=3367525 RepID=UPI0037CC7FF1